MDMLPVYCGGDTPRLINNRRLSQLTESGPLPISLMRMSSPGVETKGWRGGEGEDERTPTEAATFSLAGRRRHQRGAAASPRDLRQRAPR